MNSEILVKTALELGAYKAELIKAQDIVLSSEFRDICASNACGFYGRCWMCPPYIGEIDVLMDKVRSFSNALIYQTVATIEDSFDIEGMGRGGLNHSRISRNIGKAVAPLIKGDSLHLICGGCRFCEKCAKADNLPCFYPEEALSSMEGYGIDVYRTTKNTSLKYINGQNTVTFFSIILFSEDIDV
ncbi:MAG: DUF2284 domain-containing protein [Clostridia bacterium]|nr:DUF2284 domain-containing protein [Clostridia bacterium]